MSSAARRIAIAVVRHEGQVLIGQRPAGVPLAGLWEFPGGKLQPGESVEAAAVRECLEETGLEVLPESHLADISDQYAHGAVHLTFIACRPLDPAQTPAAPFRWVPLAELRDYEFPEANGSVLAMLR
ncbi:MAG: (deoxy)nucleoside triphosphate pyrophosphohydrolase [Pirellulaceae bacterium]|nr:(deoxy)nucleoside triphosphate pyrophosphohydrolase [Pirellulaceae bacterium]